ncbi:MAG TPA: oligogalacturonate lyase family protein [Phycisphaerae bacterium]|nr:oligogalacturonate lyase family protein [Phycisphaerae bacterium]
MGDYKVPALLLMLLGLQLASGGPVAAQTLPATAPAAEPPLSWVDPDTGHRIRRLTSEPGSTGLYFNINAYTPDGKQMVYSAPDGIHMLDIATHATRLLVGGKVHVICVGRKTPSVYYVDPDARTLNVVAVDTGKIQKIGNLPARGSVASINADETLAAGTYIEGTEGAEYGANRIMPPGQSGPLVQPLNKAEMMEERLAAHLPVVLFTMDLRSGKLLPLLHSTDWVSHLLFSPVDATLLMYCHEGPWQKVDRIWTIRTDGSENQLIHKRKMAMEIAGHEFWGIDGKRIWYDLQLPKGEDFFLAGYDVSTHERRWYHLQRNEWSIHFNVASDESLFCGDGGNPGQVAKASDGEWIELLHPELFKVTGENEKDFIQPGVFHSEHLVNMSKHNYRLEPNVRFSPDNKQVIFTSNMFGPSYVFAVDVEKAE